jgi:hypothetical protein
MVLQARYAILERVAAGAMGVVYRGERVSLGRSVAVKFLHPWIASQQAFRTRFETEARAMSRLSHPNCASVIDFGVEGASPYVVMDFIAGVTLRQLLGQGRLAPARAVAIGRQLLAGVAHAHAQNIVHRDLKPENLILGDTAGLADHVRILDFGLAKLRDGPALTSGLALGTPSYMSPEQTGAPGDIDGRTDIYAVGVLLFEMLAGRKPFIAEKVAEILVMHRDVPPPKLRQVVPEAGISAALEAVVDRALAKSPGARFQTAVEFAEALARAPEGAAAQAAASFPVGAPAPFVGAGGAIQAAGAIQIGPSLDHTVNETIAEPQHAVTTVVALGGAPAAPAAPAPVAASPSSRAGGRPPAHREKSVWVGLGVLGVLALILVAVGVRGRSAPPQPAGSSETTLRPAPGSAAVSPRNAVGPSPTGLAAPVPAPATPAPAAPAPAGPAIASSPAPGAPVPRVNNGPNKPATHVVTVGPGDAPRGKAAGPSPVAPVAPVAPAATPAPAAPAPGGKTVAAEERFRDADALIAKGEWEQALVVLEKARKENPRRPEAAYRLANTALEHKRWSEGAEAARAAAAEEPKYRSDERLVKNLIRSLVNDRGYEKSESVLQGFGPGPVPLLREAAAHDESRIVRQRAGELLESRGGASRPRTMPTSSSRPPSHPPSRPFFSR